MLGKPENRKKVVLVVEDDLGQIDYLKKMFDRYTDIELCTACSAAEAWNVIELATDGKYPNAAVFDLMMPYGNVPEKFPIRADPEEIDTGLRLLEYLREEEKREGTETPLWIAVITARSAVAVGVLVRRLLGERGTLYLKPFDPLQLEHDLVTAIGIPSQIPLGLIDRST